MMLLAPVGAGADHLKALATVARLLRSESVVERLRQLRDPARLYAVLAAPVATHQAA
jgi:PTS system nitrogen regulatory IIA component